MFALLGYGLGGLADPKWKNVKKLERTWELGGDKKAVMVGAVPKGEAAARVRKVSQTRCCQIKPHGRGWKNTKMR